MDENNQYGHSMTKPLPYDCLKKQKHYLQVLQNLIVFQIKISNDINIRDLFIVDIKFNDVNPKTLLFNEIYPPIFEKKTMEPYD